MADKVIHTSDGSGNTALIVIVIVIITIIGFLFATGRLGNLSKPQDTGSNINVDVSLPDAPNVDAPSVDTSTQ